MLAPRKWRKIGDQGLFALVEQGRNDAVVLSIETPHQAAMTFSSVEVFSFAV